MNPHWTTRSLLAWTTQHFEKKGLDSPRLSAEMLLAYVLETDRLKLYMDPDRPATPKERSRFRNLVERAIENEPVDYLIGHAPFFTLMFEVSPAVLIPRPATETLVEHILQHIRATGPKPLHIADICTGSGCIAISLAKHLPEATFVATDVSETALAIAKKNAVRHKVDDRIDFRLGDLYEPIGGDRFDYICTNPPYIPDDEWADVAPNVKDHEPVTALRGGPDGLLFIRPLIQQAGTYLKPNGQLALEHAAVHHTQLPKLIEQTPDLTNPRILNDHESLPRILIADHHHHHTHTHTHTQDHHA